MSNFISSSHYYFWKTYFYFVLWGIFFISTELKLLAQCDVSELAKDSGIKKPPVVFRFCRVLPSQSIDLLRFPWLLVCWLVQDQEEYSKSNGWLVLLTRPKLKDIDIATNIRAIYCVKNSLWQFMSQWRNIPIQVSYFKNNNSRACSTVFHRGRERLSS